MRWNVWLGCWGRAEGGKGSVCVCDPVSDAVRKRALIDDAGYREMYARSVEDNEGFWAEQAKRIDWIKPFSKVKDVSFAKPSVTCYLYTPPFPSLPFLHGHHSSISP